MVAIRSRTEGQHRPGVPEVVVVHGLGVCDYLEPATRALAGWTRAHLIDLPGCGGSDDPPHELDVPEYADLVAAWLDEHRTGPVLLAGQSSGAQVAAEAALRSPSVVAVALVCPFPDPAARSLPRLLRRCWSDLWRESPSLARVHLRDVRRTGPRRYRHLLRVHLRHVLGRPVRRLTVPVLVLGASLDPISPPAWGRHLAALAPRGSYAEVPGPHTFCWSDPRAWSEPLRALARAADDSAGGAGVSGRHAYRIFPVQ
ncbi:alpha/beta hydrolase fold protein [Actinoplanes sp. SE50]|uniref:alpha/beta fold hydrolase n=1 Tax=unclassified Actinoplanes TaxID=2626549 RepID=UPI00023EC25B|nr:MULTISPECIES: alpha/beta hydrolase [unclassified Actinoplanes]AEV83557.1 alpha/beta hydrolase fold protein [Actinoplanes sp. SE50/110]ATO82299.1 alpha/beta hydrolase fold protein [Actinoplanes sp. SE50]SLL99706.1 alpha/beta hydrolase fold protein [Actinoplanes sp. SE50/110]